MVSNQVSKTTNENLLRIKELSEKLCQYDEVSVSEVKYRQILKEMKNIFDTELANFSGMDKETKLKTYQRICLKIRIILKKLKLD